METKKYDYILVEKKWQKNWYDKKIYIASNKKKQKFFIHPQPNPSP